uniref:Uncharacterized protein n=1 Tax=Arundo donax TaxID=35708 RepID=A0A0A9D9H3_ARUDO
MSTGRERKWELATLRALARDAAQQLQQPAAAAGRELRQQQPAGRRGRDDGKADKVMHLLLWGPK